MIYYVRTGSVNTMQNANSHRQAALRTIEKFENFGKFVIVGTSDLDEESSQSSMMFFHTDSLLNDCGKSNMKLVY